MNTLDFLKRVLPSEGAYCSITINKKGALQYFHETVEELADAVLQLDRDKKNTYFAISAFNDASSREQVNVRKIKTFALDIDCGPNKPYPSWKEGVLVLSDFIRDLGLPGPMIVSSGNGLHVYWTLTEELGSDVWKPIAESFKAVAVAKFKELANRRGIISPTPTKPYIDPAVPADHARVLRPVGTHNPKGGKEVTLLLDAPPVDPEYFASFFPVTSQAQPVSHTHPATSSKLLQDLAVNSEYPPSNADAVLSKCQQLRWLVENRADKTKIDEPMWYSVIGIAAYCHNPEDTAIAWSEGHPDFDPQETVRKMEQWRRKSAGPTLCETLEQQHPNGCKGCKFKDKVRTPIRLGVQYQEVEISQDVLDETAYAVELPKPFKRTDKGIKVTIDDTDIDVSPFDLYPVGYGRDESLGYEVVRYHWKRPHVGWQPLALRQAFLTDGSREFAGAIADQGIVLTSKKQTEYFQLMLRSYMDKLRQQRTMTNLYSTMGWKNNYTEFVMGDTILRRNNDGSVTEESVMLSSSSQRLGNDLYGTMGTVEDWAAFSKLLAQIDLLAPQFVIGVSLSSPFYAFTGLKNTVVSLYGDTGSGKSLSQLWAQSVWGVPEKLHFAAKYTQNALFSRFAMYANMPLTVDETTMVDVKDVGDMIYWMTQGRDKARLNRTAEERDAREWAAPSILSTNKSMASKITASGLETTAQMARLLELHLRPHKVFGDGTQAGREIHRFITSHYGTAGREFVKHLLDLGPDGIKAIVDEAFATFNQRYGVEFSGNERFWEQAIVLADLSLRLAKEWGIIKFSSEKSIKWVLSQIGALRKTIVEQYVDGFDMISEYLNDTADAALTVFHTGAAKPTPDLSRIPRGEIRVRFDMYRKDSASKCDHGVMFFDRTHFRQWLAKRGYDYKSFVNEMNIAGLNATPKSSKASLGKDSPVKLAQCYVIGVNLNHERFKGILDDADDAIDDLAFGQLKAV